MVWKRRLSLAARLLAVAAAIAGTAWILPSAFGSSKPSAAQGAYGNAYGLHRVAICHKGHTIYVAEPAVPAHLAHGDSIGACG